MKDFIRNIKNPNFKNKAVYVLFIPVCLLSWTQRRAIRDFTVKHWDKYPGIMHRLYWTANNQR